MKTFDPYLDHLVALGQSDWIDDLSPLLDRLWYQTKDGNLPRFLKALSQLPKVKTSHIKLDQDVIEIGRPEELDDSQRQQILDVLNALKPWRKGPFRLFGITVDAEWRCDMKWQRVESHIQSLQGKRVLDVGSGNGYYALRMLAQDPLTVTAIDPSVLSVVQFLMLNHFIQDHRISVLPLAMEQVVSNLQWWDTVFSMGVLYHRRSPFDHLHELRDALRPGGQLVLETLVIDGDESSVLVPEGRYARMNNIWFLPSASALSSWLRKAGFVKPEIVDISVTTIEEQRHTEWKPGTSLPDYLNPEYPNLTKEGHPAPKRAIIVAHKSEEDKRLPRYQL